MPAIPASASNLLKGFRWVILYIGVTLGLVDEGGCRVWIIQRLVAHSWTPRFSGIGLLTICRMYISIVKCLKILLEISWFWNPLPLNKPQTRTTHRSDRRANKLGIAAGPRK